MTAELVPRLPPHALETIDRFLRAELAESDGVVLGLSGGVDSALSARLARDAIGPERVLGVVLPNDPASSSSVDEARAYARSLGIECRVIDVGPSLAGLVALFPGLSDRVTIGNIVARLRMIVLYTLAREQGRRVLGTGNKSELLLGYFTKYRDGGADLLPIGDLYKTQVWELSERLGLPETIRNRAPTAGFWPGQTDEAELGLPYRVVDRILCGVEELRSASEIAEITGLALAVVASVIRRVETYRHKRRPPPIPKVGLRTIGIDWRD